MEGQEGQEGQEGIVSEACTGCRAVATAVGDGLHFLRFELSNLGPEPIDLPTHEPFTSFSVLATGDGKPLTVHEPALDIPVRPIMLHLPPGSTVTVETPIQLRIAEGADPGDDGFIWTIRHARESVSLRVRLLLPAPFDRLFPVTFL